MFFVMALLLADFNEPGQEQGHLCRGAQEEFGAGGITAVTDEDAPAMRAAKDTEGVLVSLVIAQVDGQQARVAGQRPYLRR